MKDYVNDKLFITEIINDIYRQDNSFGGKAETMLHDWARELRENCRTSFPASRLRRVHAKENGRNNW